MGIHEPIYVDSDFQSAFEAEIFSTKITLDDIAYARIVFNIELVTPEILRNNPQLITDSIKLDYIDLGKYYIDNLNTNKQINNLMLFNENDELIATRFLNKSVSLEDVKSFKILITCYSKTSTIIKADYVINYDKHINDAYENGITSEHPNLLNEENNIATRDFIEEKHRDFIENNETIIKEVENFDENDTDHIQIKENIPTIYAGRGNKYSYFLWYYWNTEAIEAKVKEIFPDFELKHRPFINFNDKLGSYLYYYEFREDFIIMIFAGSNSNNAIDIFVVENRYNLSYTDYENLNNNHEYRLKINRFYDRIYFVINNKAYTIFSENSDYTPETIREPVNAGYLSYSLRYYAPINLNIEELLDGENVYMAEFSDIGDVLIQYKNNKIKFFNIFGDECEDELDYHLLNTYLIDNRPEAKILINMYNTTAQQLKYIIDNNFSVVYLGSEYSVYYDRSYDKYVILFKLPKYTQRTRRSIDNLEAFVGSYILFKDSHIESVYGLDLENSDSFFGSKFDTESKPLVAVDRGVIVVHSDNYKGCFRNT